MKKIALLFCVAIVFASCKSKKGSWTSSDKEKAQKEVEKYSSSLEILGKNKDLCFKCYLSNLEKKYENAYTFDEEKSMKEVLVEMEKTDCAFGVAILKLGMKAK